MNIIRQFLYSSDQFFTSKDKKFLFSIACHQSAVRITLLLRAAMLLPQRPQSINEIWDVKNSAQIKCLYFKVHIIFNYSRVAPLAGQRYNLDIDEGAWVIASTNLGLKSVLKGFCNLLFIIIWIFQVQGGLNIIRLWSSSSAFDRTAHAGVLWEKKLKVIFLGRGSLSAFNRIASAEDSPFQKNPDFLENAPSHGR